MHFLEFKPNNPAIYKSVILWDDCVNFPHFILPQDTMANIYLEWIYL